MSLKIGMIGLDTSHVEIFTKLLYENPSLYDQARIVIGSPSPSPDLDLSANRVNGYTHLLKNEYDVTITTSEEEVVSESDSIMITSVDGRKHLDLFKRIAPFKKPVFIDKPLALSLKEAEEIYNLSEKYNTPVMSSSSLRFADSLQKHFPKTKEVPNGVYISGPLPFVDEMPYYYWYGIHMIEMLFKIMGTDYKDISIQKNENFDVIITEWNDGRFGIVRGDHNWHDKFEAFLHYEDGTVHLPIYQDQKTYYACLLEQIIHFFETGISPVSKNETLTLVKFIEEANKLRMVGV
ncbi:Gfo/Idh/MocA family oxidoreductase [Virgibacillus oceani]